MDNYNDYDYYTDDNQYNTGYDQNYVDEYQIQTTDYQYYDESYYVPQEIDEEGLKKSKTLSIVGFALGCAALAFCIICCCSFIPAPFPFGIAGLITSLLGMKKYKDITGNSNVAEGVESLNDNTESKKDNQQKVFTILGIVFSSIGILVGIVYLVFFIVNTFVGSVFSAAMLDAIKNDISRYNYR